MYWSYVFNDEWFVMFIIIYKYGFIVWFYCFFKGRIWIGWIKVKYNNVFDWNFKYELGEEGFLIFVSLFDGFLSYE